MPKKRVFSPEKVKRWFRKQSRVDDSSSTASVTNASTSLQTTISQSSTFCEEATSSKSIQSSFESFSPTVQEDKSPSHISPPIKAVTGAAIKTTSPKQDPLKQARLFLNDNERNLFDTLEENGGRKTMFSDLHKAVLEKQEISEAKAWKVTFGGRRILLRDVTAKIVNWLNSFKQIGDLIAQADAVHIGLPWGAVKIILSVVTQDQEQMGLILISMEQAICLMARCSIYHQLYLDNVVPITNAQNDAISELSNAMARLYWKMFSLLAYYLHLLDRNVIARTLKAFSSPSEVSDILQEMGKYERRVSDQADLCEKLFVRPTLQSIDKNSRKTIDTLREMMSQFDKEMIQLWKQLNEDERCKILQWVSDIKYEDDHRAASKGRVNGTGEWLICHEAYLKWKQSSKSTLLWLNGIPGAGKTKLSTRVVDDLQALLHSQPHQAIGFAHFYCDHNRADRNDPVAITRSIVRQLCCSLGNTSIDTSVEDQYMRRKAKGFASGRLTADECRDLLLRLVAGYQNVYIVVDGLDECDRASRHILMDLLEELLEKFEQSIKVYIASRKATDLTKRYQKGDHLEVSANNNQADIEKFVLDKMNQSDFCRTRLSTKLRDQILRTFHDKSQGMFQWATLHIKELLQLERQADIEQYLHELPQGLEAAYEKIFDQIACQRGSKRKVAFAAFQILMVSWRPLHPFELAIAVAQEPNRDFIVDHDVDIAYVLDACHNLLIVADGSLESDISAESRMRSAYDYHYLQEVDDHAPFPIEAIWESDFGITQHSICKFSHLSVQEYLEAKHWSSSEAHGFIGAICMRTLLCLQLPKASAPQDRTPDGDEDDKYGKEWDDPVILSVAETTKKKLMKVILLGDKEKFPSLSEPIPFVSTPKHDLSDTVLESAEQQATHDIRHENLEAKPSVMPSTANVLRSDLETVTTAFRPPPFQCFVEFVNSHSRKHGDNESCYSQTFEPYLENNERSPLQAWALYCAKGLTFHLEGHNLAGEKKETPEALSRDTLEQFLGSPSNSSIHYKAWLRLMQNLWFSGHYSKSRGESLGRPDRKINRFVNFRAQVVPKSKPSFGCVILSLHEILDLWLSEKKILPDERNACGYSLLHLAVGYDNLEISKVLVKHGANPHLPDFSGFTPLELAIDDSKTDFVRLLSENAAITEDMVNNAVSCGNAAMVEILPNRTKSPSYRGPVLQLSEALTTATSYGANLVDVLLSYLEKDGNIDLQAVIHKGLDGVRPHETGIDIMKALMKHTKVGIRHSLIHRAVSEDSWAFAEEAVAAGLDANSTSITHSGETPLHCLFRQQHGDVLSKTQKLLDWGAKVDARDIDGNTPLMTGMMTSMCHSKVLISNESENGEVAEFEGTSSRLEACDVLLRHGADINAVNNYGLSVLGIACLYAVVTPSTIQFLLDRGASVTMTQGSGDIIMSPLDILRLHEMPLYESQDNFRGHRLEVFRMKLKNSGANHLRDDGYEAMSFEEKSKWIRCHRVGGFAAIEDISPSTTESPTSVMVGPSGIQVKALKGETHGGSS